MAMRDVLEIDALSVYVRRNRKGELQGLDLVDGASIKPLLDARGRTPSAPLPGYQQVLYGVPAGLYTDQDILYRRENPRTDSAYGFSRVEMIVMRVNQALRKQTFDLARFTDGNVPAGLLSVPTETDWTPEQIKLFEDEFNALLAGNDQRRNRIKVLPPGMVYTPTTAPDLMTPFDQFLLNVTVGAFGLTMAELGFTEDVNKSSGESLENVLYRRAVRPSANFIAALFTAVIRRFYGRRYKYAWQSQEEEDKNSQADRYAKLIPIGAASIDDYCGEIGQPKPGIDRYVMTTQGPVFFDVLLKQREQQLKALDHPDTLALPPGATRPQPEPQRADDEPDGGAQQTGGANDQDGDRLRLADLRRYEQVALKAVKAGKTVRAFESAAIPAGELAALRGRQAGCETADEVRAAFAERDGGNPYHDALGKFASGPGQGAGSSRPASLPAKPPYAPAADAKAGRIGGVAQATGDDLVRRGTIAGYSVDTNGAPWLDDDHPTMVYRMYHQDHGAHDFNESNLRDFRQHANALGTVKTPTGLIYGNVRNEGWPRDPGVPIDGDIERSRQKEAVVVQLDPGRVQDAATLLHDRYWCQGGAEQSGHSGVNDAGQTFDYTGKAPGSWQYPDAYIVNHAAGNIPDHVVEANLHYRDTPQGRMTVYTRKGTSAPDDRWRTKPILLHESWRKLLQ